MVDRRAPRTREERAADPALAALLESSRSGAETVAEGGFRLDWSRALEKVKRFQLTDPHRYVLELVQGAVAAGATAVEVQTDADDVILRFDGRPASRGDLERLFDHLFTRDRTKTMLRQLALGINASLALRPKFVLLESGDGREGSRLRLTSHTDLSLEPLAPGELFTGTRIHVRDRVSWRTVVDALGKNPVEGRLLAEGCRFAPIPVRLNGRSIQQRFEPEAIARHAFQTDGIRGELVLPLTPLARTRVTLCMNGVQLCDLDFEEPVGAVAACIDNPSLTRNASHSDVVRDQELTRTMKVLGREVQRMLLDWLRRLFAGGEPVVGPTELGYLRLAAFALLRATRKTPNPPELERLIDLPGLVELPLSPPRASSLRPFWTAFQTTGRCRTCDRRIGLDALPPELLAAHGPFPMLSAIFANKLESVSAELQTLETGAANRRRREAQRQEAVLPPRAALVKTPLKPLPDLELRGEIGLRAERGPEAVELTLLRDGVPLDQQKIVLGSLSALAVIDSPGFEPTPAWDGILDGPALAAAKRAISGAAPGLLAALREGFPQPPPPEVLTRLERWSPEAGPPRGELPRWARDPQSALARQHLEDLLEVGPRLARELAPWLWSWPIFHTVEGEALSLDEVAALDPANFVREQPWGATGEEAPVLNLSEKQLRILHRYLGPKLRSHSKALATRRRLLEVKARAERQRAQNRERAEQRRQDPRLEQERYLAIVDLPEAVGQGQAGVPHGSRESFVRFLIDGLPVCERTIEVKSFPIQAVLEAKGVSANDVFDDVIPPERVKGILGSVRAQAWQLAEVIAERIPAEPALRPLLWSYLASLPATRRKALPGPVMAAPLCPTVSHGWLSLQALAESASRFGHLRRVSAPAPRQLSEAPYLLCDAAQGKLLKHVLGTRVVDGSRALESELKVLERMERPREPARISESTVLCTKVVGPLIEGELGIPIDWSGPPRGGADLSRIRILADGIPLETRSLSLQSLPLCGVLSSPRFKPSRAWDSVVDDAAWQDGLRALEAAAERLVLQGCAAIARGELGGIACSLTCLALQTMAGQRFRGQPGLELEGAPELDWALARAPIWLTPEDQRISLEAIARGFSAAGSVLVVEREQGHVASDHVILSVPEPGTRVALASIFGEPELEDGREALRRDEAAYQRQRQAPAITPQHALAAVLTVEVDAASATGSELEASGRVGPSRSYGEAEPGVLVTIGMRGRRLCERRFDHSLRGVGVLDCTGLRANRDWDGIGDASQGEQLARLCGEALWRAVERVAARAERFSRDSLDDEDRRLFLADALGHLSVNGERRELREQILRAPIFRNVEGRALVASELLSLAAAGETIRVVGDELPEGRPVDGRLILRAGSVEREALARLLGGALEDHDDRWREELAGAERRRLSERATPKLELESVALCYFTVGGTSGVAGLLAPSPSGAPFGDEQDRRSSVRLHVDRRQVEVRAPSWHPAVEVWVNDDRLQPAPSFLAVLDDENLDRVLSVARSQIPELAARAAERRCVRWRDEPGDATRLRLCRYVADRREALFVAAEAGPLSPEARLLETPLWLTLGGELVSTRAVLSAAARGRIGYVAQGSEGALELDDFLVLAVRGPEQAALEVLGGIPDLTTKLQQENARRAFLRREPVDRVDLAAVSEDRWVLAHRRISDASRRGELALLAFPGGEPKLTLHLFLERRAVQRIEIDWIAEAAAAIECSTLTIDDSYEGFVADESFAAFQGSLLVELERLLEELCSRAPSLPREQRSQATRTLIEAAAALSRRHGLVAESELGRRLLETPLLERAGEGHLSLAELLTAPPPVRYLRPEAEAPLAIGGSGPVLRLDERLVASLKPLAPLRDVSEEIGREIQRERRIAEAHRAAVIRWEETLCRAQVERGELRGELALALPAKAATLWLRLEGRPVSVFDRDQLPGLTGFLDGPFSADAALERVAPTASQLVDLRSLYRERLEALVELALAASPERGALYLNLCAYVASYLSWSLEERTTRRRSRARWADLIRTAGDLPDAVVRALGVRLLLDTRGDWHDLRWAASRGGGGSFVWCSETREAAPDGVELLLDTGPGVRALLERVVGGKAVLSHELWRRREVVAAQHTRAAKSKPAGPRPSAGNAALLRALQSLLRRVAGAGLSQQELGAMQSRKLAREALVQLQGQRIVLNHEHALWKLARGQIHSGEDPTLLFHLAAAVCAALHEQPEREAQRAHAIELLLGLAEARLGVAGPSPD